MRGSALIVSWLAAETDFSSSITEGALHYTHEAGGEERLFDTSVDPWERNDLIRSAAHGKALLRLRRRLLTMQGGSWETSLRGGSR